MSKPWPPPRAAELDLDALEVLADAAADDLGGDDSAAACEAFLTAWAAYRDATEPPTVKALIARVRRAEADRAYWRERFAEEDDE